MPVLGPTASQIKERVRFRGSADYWERRYARGSTSGAGSYGSVAQRKADFLNQFVLDHQIESVIEFGVGDGNQLSLVRYPRYVGLDVSRSVIQRCIERFAEDPSKSFFLYAPDCFADRAAVLTADLALSLDVVYHLVEEKVFETHMTHLFGAAERFVVVFSSDEDLPVSAPHVRHRQFTDWVIRNEPAWEQIDADPTGTPGTARFFVYERRSFPATHSARSVSS